MLNSTNFKSTQKNEFLNNNNFLGKTHAKNHAKTPLGQRGVAKVTYFSYEKLIIRIN